MMTYYGYSDISLIANKGKAMSRVDCDTSVRFGPQVFDMPIIPANMKCVIGAELAGVFASRNLLHIMHRYENTTLEYMNWLRDNPHITPSFSVGINYNDTKLLDKIKQEFHLPENFYITIDSAHGHCEKMKSMIKFVKDKFPNAFVIAGNVMTPEALIELEEWGADSVKVGIGPGHACTTYNKTGFGGDIQFSIVQECCKVAKKPVIADGGISEHGDIAKALVAGATMVMIGYMLCGFDENPGSLIEIDGNEYKEYFGSASKYNKNTHRNIEGRKLLVRYKGSIIPYLDELHEDLQSSISYAGGTDLSAFNTVKYAVNYGGGR